MTSSPGSFLSRTLDALSACRAPTDYYRVQVDIMKHATPADVAALAQQPSAGNPEFDTWLGALHQSLSLPGSDIQDFRFSRLSDSVTLYSGVARASVLVIALCGKADLLFMPIPIFLQYFSPERHAVLVLRDPARNGFLGGIQGHSDTFREMIDRLSVDCDIARFDEIRTLGTSGGGAPALATGLVLGAASAVAFSGHLPSASIRYSDHAGVDALEAVLRQSGRSAGYACVYGADNKNDARHALELAALMPVKLIPVPGIAGHNVVFELHKRRQLAPLLATIGLAN